MPGLVPQGIVSTVTVKRQIINTDQIRFQWICGAFYLDQNFPYFLLQKTGRVFVLKYAVEPFKHLAELFKYMIEFWSINRKPKSRPGVRKSQSSLKRLGRVLGSQNDPCCPSQTR